ncbi:hypothetical protein GGF43_000712 [Coemansia sp. RSA 2618]|nr:hypothetical protein GGF43_000712 [Coemansia sp. RSA 2618]
MDSFLKNIKSQTYALNGWDFISSFANIPFSYYFKNTNSDGVAADFMPSSLLRASFLRTLQEFPILAGHLVMDKGRGFIVVDKNNLNMPEYFESQSSIDYKFVEAGGFSWESLPHKVATVTASPSKSASGQLKLVNVNVVRLRNNSGLVLFINMPHYVVDGVGYSAFVRRWAEVCTWMQDGKYTTELPHREYTFDRSLISAAMTDDMLPLDKPCSRAFATKTLLGQLLARLSPETLGDVLVEGTKLMPATGHIFHISKRTITEIRQRIAKTEQVGELRISDNDILTAMISQAVAQGVEEKSKTRKFFSSALRAVTRPLLSKDEFLTLVVADIRPRLKHLKQLTSAQYAGGCITGMPIFNSTSKLVESGSNNTAFAGIAASVRKMVSNLTDEYISGLDYQIGGNSTSYAHALALAITTAEKVIITNQTRFGLYECDFGFGTPKWISPMSSFVTNFASILPVNPTQDGYNVYLSLEKYVMNSVLKNEFWSQHTDLIY